MAARDTLIERAAPFLEDGEVVDHAFRARVLIPGTKLAKATYVVIGTQRSVLILKTSIWSTKTPKTLVARVPRGTPMSFRKGARCRGRAWRSATTSSASAASGPSAKPSDLSPPPRPPLPDKSR